MTHSNRWIGWTLCLLLGGAGEAFPQAGTPPESEEQAVQEESAEEKGTKEKAVDPAMERFMAFSKALRASPGLDSESNHLQQLEGFRQLTEEFGGQDPEIDEILASYVSWKLSGVGRYGDAHEVFDRSTPQEPVTDEQLEIQRRSLGGLRPDDALEALTEASRGRQAVFINEAHHVPMHRLLTLRLLPEWRRQGFTHFAAETLSEDMDELAERGYPNGRTGVYTDEPLYGDIVRTALRLGFEVVRYEAGGGSKKREPGQARHLMERIFEEQPKARLVVHLGYGHNRESADSFRGIGAMAFHFREMSGIDPLTIDQTELSEHGDPSKEHPLYETLCGSSENTGGLVYLQKNGNLWSLPGSNRDVTVCHPRQRLERGRPTWMTEGDLRQRIRLPEDVCGEVESCLIEARFVEEGDDAIPVDRLQVRAGEPTPDLMLPVGEMEIIVLGTDRSHIHTSRLEVRKKASQAKHP